MAFAGDPMLPIFKVFVAHLFVLFLKHRKRADMRFDCAMASGLRVGPTKFEPKLFKNHSKMDIEKRFAQKECKSLVFP